MVRLYLYILLIIYDIVILWVLFNINHNRYYINNTDNTNTLILQYENRSYVREKFSKLLNRNREYADKHDYDYKLITTVSDNIPPYWLKVHYIQKYLPQYDYVVWIDSDAVIHDINRNVTDFFTSSQHLMVIAPDPPKWSSKFMAGVFMIKRSPYTIELVNDWMLYYDVNKWKLIDGKWKCYMKPNIECNWAGHEYEQGSFIELMDLREYKWFIFSVPYYYFHAINNDNNHDYVFSYHFAGEYRINSNKYIDNL